MSEKVRDKYKRWRCITVAFRVSAEENEAINRMVKISGLKKQDYIVKRLENKEVVVVGNPRVYKGLKNLLQEILEKLTELKPGEFFPDGEYLETIQVIANVLNEMKKEEEDTND